MSSSSTTTPSPPWHPAAYRGRSVAVAQSSRPKTSTVTPPPSSSSHTHGRRGTGRKSGTRVGRTSGQAALPRKSGRGLSGTTTTTTLTAHATEGTPTVLLPYHCRSLYTNRQSQSPDPNVLTFLQTSCPDDVLPRVLAFAGPQQIAVLQKTNRFWKTLLERDGTWRVLCEELYKWKPGDAEPACWKTYYRMNPCVPVDFRTVHQALQIANAPTVLPTRRGVVPPHPTQNRSLRVWLRPGRHVLHKPVTVQALPGVQLHLETMDLPANVYCATPAAAAPLERIAETTPETSPRRIHRRRLLRGCSRGAADAADADATGNAEPDESDPSETSFRSESTDGTSATGASTRATLVLRSRRHNQPAIWVKQGVLVAKGLDICHNSYGLDIWNGNAAIQIQPPLTDDQPVQVHPRPTALLEHCKITSRSGRGVVNIDGGSVTIRGCAIHDCAATGLYVGGTGSQALVSHTDVVTNGVGNQQSRRGIARGHSGVYLEQGMARIVDSNISRNTLTGISAVSHDNAVLALLRSDLVRNGTLQIEVPPLGSQARRQSRLEDNRVDLAGPVPSRSGLVPSTS